MEVTITNNGGYITIDDNRDPAFSSTLDVLKDGLDLLQFGDVLRIVYKDGTWFESLATQSEVVGLSGSITPADGLEFYAAMWDVLADYGSGSGGGGSPTGSAGGDLTGTYPNPTVHRIHGIDMQNGTPSADDVWVYGGSPAKWQHQKLHASQVTNDSGVTGTNVDDALDHLDSTKTTASAVASQITTALTGYATQAWVASQGYITSVIGSLGFTPENVANKSTSVVTDQASNTKYPSVKAVFDWATSVFMPDNGLIDIVNRENYPSTSNSYACLYVASVGKLYVCNNASNTVLIYNTSTGALLATISVTAAFRPLLAKNWATGSAVDEVWITSTSLTTINRISTTTDASLGTITGATTTGFEIVNYSSTKCFITCSVGSGAMLVINPTTLAVSATVTTNMSSFPSGMALNTNASSSQFDKIVVSAQSGVIIFDPSTNAVSTTISNPSGAISTGREIRYNATKDKYYVANSVGNTFVELSIATSTTFTASNSIRNIQNAFSVQIDEASGLMFVSSVDSSQVGVLINLIDFTTLALLESFRTNTSITSGATESSISIDTANKMLYVIGRRTTSNAVCAIKYF